jgi:hypothetical protein
VCSGKLLKIMAEGTGLEPAYPFGRRFSRPLHYHYATPPIVAAETITYRRELAQPWPSASLARLEADTARRLKNQIERSGNG